MGKSDSSTPELRRRHARIESILDAAAELFASAGYEHTSLSDVADRVDLSPKALYHYYSSKRALLEAVLIREFDYFEASRLAAARDRLAGLALVDALTESVVDGLRELLMHGNLLLVSFAEGTRDGDVIRQRHNEFRQNWSDHIAAIVEAHPDVPAHRRAEFTQRLLWLLFGTVVDTVLWPQPEVARGTEPSRSFARSVVIDLLDGLRAPQPSVARTRREARAAESRTTTSKPMQTRSGA
ncbi:TetR/AcrR family transcriptional regulator [Mycobacterium deserti]|uniref:TetR/AcrR family transcriptional regulator n=1 Tax=Mycobacterium deserti TaxID=2978347 RepID=A0ABT2MEK2_9MYCO|nr:TetR/AcrR family transcriptional regulator [Mycobacterium deserti]MCT7660704.1 TetR/AcrR family transcriptional regulator [Mycobacterium deserti]